MYLRNLGVENMFHIHESFWQSDFTGFLTPTWSQTSFMSLYSVLNFSLISFKISVTLHWVDGIPENILSRWSETELTTVVISLPSEDEILLFHNFIHSRHVVVGYKPLGRGGRDRIFPGSGKICDHSNRLFIAVFFWCLGKIFLPFGYWFTHFQPNFPLVFRYVCHIKTWILKRICRIVLKINKPWLHSTI